MATSRIKSVRPPAPVEFPPVRFSRLKKLDDYNGSPAHYQYGFTGETDPMAKGTALHAYMLGGSDRVVVYRGGARNEKFQKWRDFQAEHEGQHIIIPSQEREVEGMRRSLEAHPRAMELLDDGVQEERITWEFGGRKCAGTPDVVKPKPGGKKRLVELKTCMTSNPRRFKWQGEKMAYHAQVAWYADGLERTMQYAHGPVDEVYIVAVESNPPWPVTVIRVGSSMLKKGRECYREWMSLLRICEQNNHWPAYAEGDVDWEDEDENGLDWSKSA